MKRHAGFSNGLVMCLAVIAFLTLVSMVQARDAWRGTSSLSIKVTALNEGDSQEIRFANLTMPMTATIELYTDHGDLASNDEGCYIKSFSDEGIAICFKNLAAISTQIQKSKTDQLLLIGTGEFNITIMGISLSGIIYLDTKGTTKKDSSGNVISMDFNGKIGGASDLAVFSSSIKTTLTK